MTPPTPLCLLICGSVDDGKSTLIDRLRDGQTPAWRFIIDEAPAHEELIRSLATGAPAADVAVVLIDARKGVVAETRRHIYIAHLMGIREILLAVNKMDLAGYDEEAFKAIARDGRGAAEEIGVGQVTAIPVSATNGDNARTASEAMPWYTGPTVRAFLETVSVAAAHHASGFRMPVQAVSSPETGFPEVTGTVAGGPVRSGDPVIVEPAGVATRVTAIATADGSLDVAAPGAAVTLALADAVDVGPGDVLRHADSEMQITDQLQAHLIWVADAEMIPGRRYTMKLAARSVTASVSELKYVVNLKTMEHAAAKTLHRNDIAVCNFSLDARVACDPCKDCPETGAFILTDRATGETVGAGMIDFGLRRARNLTRQRLSLDKQTRAAAMGQKPALLWFTGLSGAGKSTVAVHVEERLHAMGRRTYMLDGDNVRHGLNRDLGFTDVDRVENIRRMAEVAKLFVDAGMIVLVSAISPFRSDRDMARSLVNSDEFFEVHIAASLATCEARDPKGLYARARKGEIANFTGISSPYEEPLSPELRVDTDALDPDAAAQRVVEMLERGKG